MEQNNSAKYAFFYMLSLVALIFIAIPSGMIIFQIINKKIIDVISQNSAMFSSDQLKFAISALVISAPIYYLTMRQILKNLFSGALQKDAGVRKWLTYFILLVSSVVMLGWLVAIINNFLDGELTAKFILKALAAIGIAAAIFSFYFYEIKRIEVENKKDKMIQIYFYGSLAAIIIIFISSLFFVETPQEARNRKHDEDVISKFSQIDSAINTYYMEKKKVPANLDDLLSDVNFITEADTKDSYTKEKFGYNAIATSTYELCADFYSSDKNKEEENEFFYDKRWLHDSGHQCLKQKIIQEECKGGTCNAAPQ